MRGYCHSDAAREVRLIEVSSARTRRVLLLCGSPELVRSLPVPLSPDAYSYFAHKAADFRACVCALNVFLVDLVIVVCWSCGFF